MAVFATEYQISFVFSQHELDIGAAIDATVNSADNIILRVEFLL